jgi:uncharacterized protein (TIGR03435 family)
MAICLLAAGADALPGQAPPAGTLPKFEVASINPAAPDQTMQRAGFAPGGRFVATNVSVRDLIAIAYGTPGPMQSFRILNGPEWIDKERVDVNAKAPGNPEPGRAGPPMELIAMVRSMLVDRFALAAHSETRDMPIYELMLDRGDRRLGPNLRVSTTDCAALARAGGAPPPPGTPMPCGTMTGIGRMSIGSTTMTILAAVLSRLTNRMVIDKTGLSERYDGSLEFTPEPTMLPPNLPPGAPAPPPDAPSLFTALKEQLGLKLEPARGPVDVLVIERIEHPTPD